MFVDGFVDGFVRILAATMALAVTACATPAVSDAASTASAIPADQQAFLDACEPWDEWDKPAPPFKVYGDTYHVGTCGISSILIANDAGHIVIDSGTEAGAKIVLENIRALGFDPTRVEILLHSHEHFDHVGGMAFLEAETGATVHASPEAALVMTISGELLPDDPQFGSHEPMKPVGSLIVLKGKNQVWDERVNSYSLKHGGLTLHAIRTPGHSPGALSWAWQECEERCENIVYADSLSPVSRDDYKFSDHPQYLAEFRTGLARLERQECSLLLTPHPSHSRMLKRMKAGKLIQNAPGDKPCKDYAAGKVEDIEKRLMKERGETQ